MKAVKTCILNCSTYMSLFSMEHSKTTYRVDIVLYAAAVVLLAAFLLVAGQRGQRLEIVVFVGVGLASWTLIEYALHRFVMHGLQPFLHHHAIGQSSYCGVTSAFWEHVFGSRPAEKMTSEQT